MSAFSPDRLPDDSSRLALRKDAQATLAAYKAFLDDPAFQHRIDLRVLTKIAGDDTMPVRERRRAAEILGKLYIQALDKVADLSCAREQMMQQLGIDPSAKAVAVTQVNTKIEIVRTDDWRAATAEIVDAEVVPHPPTEDADEPAAQP